MDLKHTIIYGVEGQTTITIKGCCQLLVLCGKVSCLGFTLTAKSPGKFIKLASLKSHSFLTMTTEQEDTLKEIDIERLQLSGNELEVLTDIISSTSCTVIFAAKSDYGKISRYLQKFDVNLFRIRRLKRGKLIKNTRQISYHLGLSENFRQTKILLSDDWRTAAYQVFDQEGILRIF